MSTKANGAPTQLRVTALGAGWGGRLLAARPADALLLTKTSISYTLCGIGRVAIRHISSTEFDLLATLLESPGRVFTRMQLLDKVQGYTYEGYERTVDAHVKNLHQKIEEDPKHPRYILTVYGLGYKFAEQDGQ